MIVSIFSINVNRLINAVIIKAIYHTRVYYNVFNVYLVFLRSVSHSLYQEVWDTTVKVSTVTGGQGCVVTEVRASVPGTCSVASVSRPINRSLFLMTMPT